MTQAATNDQISERPPEDPPPGNEPVVELKAAPADLAPKVEAILLSSPRPVPVRRIGIALGMIRETEADAEEPATETPQAPNADPAGDVPEVAPPKKRKRSAKVESADAAAVQAIVGAITGLNAEYERSGRSFRVEQVAGGYRVMTLPVYAAAVAAYHKSRQSTKLTRAAIETLAIIAYRQPITRAELEAIRGVACGEVLRSLMERRMVTMKGRAEEVGRPILYGTTKQFLDVFGLASLKDLPTIQELKMPT